MRPCHITRCARTQQQKHQHDTNHEHTRTHNTPRRGARFLVIRTSKTSTRTANTRTHSGSGSGSRVACSSTGYNVRRRTGHGCRLRAFSSKVTAKFNPPHLPNASWPVAGGQEESCTEYATFQLSSFRGVGKKKRNFSNIRRCATLIPTHNTDWLAGWLTYCDLSSPMCYTLLLVGCR